MIKLTERELLNILGGENPEECTKLQHEVADFATDDPRFDEWIESFYRDCVEGEQGDFQ